MRRVSFVVFPILSVVAFAVAGSACSSSQAPIEMGSTTGADSWTTAEDPANLLPGSKTALVDVISADDVGKTFGVDDDRVPYPDTYWPFAEGGTDAKWNGDAATPIEKFMALNDPAHVQNAKDWEHANHGPALPNVASWWGHCPGWTGAAMSNPPLQHSVLAKSDGHGGVASCTTEGTDGCVKFEIGDINALEAESWVDGESNFLGARCDIAPADIKRDAYGRIVRDGSGCKGLNAGALMVVLANRMKMAKLPMAIDAQNAFNTDEIWNQPAYRYEVFGFSTLTKAAAVDLVAEGKAADETDYQWNESAKGFVRVDIGIKWIKEHGPNLTAYAGTDSTYQMRFVAVIELDGDPAATGTRIIGGEYLDEKTVSFADRLIVPPFVWISTGSGSDNLSTDDTRGHNPYVKPSVVKQLVALGAAR